MSPPDRSLDDFSEMDWRIMNRLTGSEVLTELDFNEEDRKNWLAAARKCVVEDCERQACAYGFLRLYEEIFAMDVSISPALTCEPRLISVQRQSSNSRSLPDGGGRLAEGKGGAPDTYSLLESDDEQCSASLRHAVSS